MFANSLARIKGGCCRLFYDISEDISDLAGNGFSHPHLEIEVACFSSAFALGSHALQSYLLAISYPRRKFDSQLLRLSSVKVGGFSSLPGLPG